MNTSMPAARPRRQTVEVCRVSEGGRFKFDRWELLSLVVELRKHLDLNDRDISVLRAHLSVLPHGPLDPMGLNVSFMSVAELLARACGMDERRFRRGEARLEAAGLINRKLSANGRRFPERDREGRIISAYGIDLAPLLGRVFELQELHEELEASRLALRSLRNEISARFAGLTRALTSAGSPLPQKIESMRERLRRTLRRKAPSPDELRDLHEEITMLETATPRSEPEPSIVTASAACAVGRISDVAEAPPHDDNFAAPTHAAVSPDNFTGDDGQTVRHIESQPKEINLRRQHGKREVSISSAWSNASCIREFFPDAPSSEHQLARILMDFSGFIGLGQKSVLPAFQLLGPAKMILLLNYLGRNIAQIVKPEAYLRSMLRSYEKGEPIAGGLVCPAA